MVNLNFTPFSSSSPKPSSSLSDQPKRYLHNLSKGDHVVRWTRLVIYPIQVHGIVLSASDDVLTIVDFGLTATSTAATTATTIAERNESNDENNNDHENKNNTSSSSSSSSSSLLEELVNQINHEDKAMIQTCEEHRHEIQGPDRINILVLTEEKDMKQWKKVEYEDAVVKKKKFLWPWWGNDKKDSDGGGDDCDNHGDEKEKMKMDESGTQSVENNSFKNEKKNGSLKDCNYVMKVNKGKGKNDSESYNDDSNGNRNVVVENDDDDDQDVAMEQSTIIEENHNEFESTATTRSTLESTTQHSGERTIEISQNKQKTTIKQKHENTTTLESSDDKNNTDNLNNETLSKEEHRQIIPPSSNDENDDSKDIPESLQTRADPTNIVIARVRYLVSNPHILPPHHILWSNSECIAVWCKTGVWSTFQARVYLHSTAAGNFKTAVTAAAGVAGSTVTTTVPASGIAGWFGMTTTTTVSLVSVQPWLIPALAGYGIIAVGGPYLFLMKCHEHWKRYTTELNDKFWSELECDVYVEAIKCWSGLE